jgi:hypothetical protein
MNGRTWGRIGRAEYGTFLHKRMADALRQPRCVIAKLPCQAEITAVDSRGRNHERRCHGRRCWDKVIGDGRIWGQAPNLCLSLLCTRKIEKRTLRLIACHRRRICWPHVGLKRWHHISEMKEGIQQSNTTHVQSGVCCCIGTYCSCLGSREPM